MHLIFVLDCMGITDIERLFGPRAYRIWQKTCMGLCLYQYIELHFTAVLGVFSFFHFIA
jgi:hypothetical protein